jgi:tRNA(fMet)-specific endonuclease VapC
MKGKDVKAARKFASLEAGAVGISVISVCELRYGVEKSARALENEAVLDEFLGELEVVPFGTGAAASYARIRNGLEKRGTPIGTMDILIAAHALDLGTKLVTNNSREFTRVPGLKTENWVA